MAGPDWDREADVVVLGLGAAGCAAAIEAHDAGASVVVLEKMPAGREGGNTRVSGGVWFDNSDPEGIATYLRALCGEFPVPEEIIQVWAHETAQNSAWVESLGARVAPHGDYRPEFPELPGSESYGGYIGVDGELGNGRLFAALAAAVQRAWYRGVARYAGTRTAAGRLGRHRGRRGAERGERGRDAAARARATRCRARHRGVREQPGRWCATTCSCRTRPSGGRPPGPATASAWRSRWAPTSGTWTTWRPPSASARPAGRAASTSPSSSRAASSSPAWTAGG